MATEFNYLVNVDTNRVMGAMAEVRSQIGMAFGSATGFQSPAMALPGGGFSTLGDVAGGAASGFAQMLGAMAQNRVMLGFGGTHTNPAMANVPHFGALQAETTLAQEQRIAQGGLAAAQEMRPPGVSAMDYALAAHRNYVDRQMEARAQAGSAALGAVATTGGSLIAGEAAGAIGGIVGSRLGGALAGRLGFSADSGKLIGGLAGSFMAWGIGADYASEKIQERFRDAEQAVGISRELGEIVGAGRGLSRTERFGLGRAAYQAAEDLNLNQQVMGDIMALASNAGMLPDTKNPETAREQFRKYAQAIDEGAQVIGGSLAQATQVIKNAVDQGKTAQEGILEVAGMGGVGAYSRYMAFGQMGAGVARSMRMTGAQGFGTFTAAIGQAAGAGMSGEEMKILGGRYGAAQMIGMTTLAAAGGPMGDLQLMAAQSGQALGGIMDLPGQAMAAMGDGDMLTNLARFQINQDDIRRGIGTKGIRTMVRQQLEAGGAMMQDFMPGLSDREAQRFFVQNTMGLNPTQAEAYVGGFYARGPSGAMKFGRRALGAQMLSLGGYAPPEEEESFIESSLRNTKGMAMGGAAIGGMFGIPGAIAGGAIGGAVSLGYRAWDYAGDTVGLVGDLITGSSLESALARQQQKLNAEADRRDQEYKSRQGIIEVDPLVAGRAATNDFGGVNLDVDSLSPVAGRRLSALMQLGGYSPTAGGPGTTLMGGKSFSTQDVQERIRRDRSSKKLSKDDAEAASDAAWEVSLIDRGRRGSGPGYARSVVNNLQRAMRGGDGTDAAVKDANSNARSLINMLSPGARRDRLLKEFGAEGFGSKYFQSFFNEIAGAPDLPDLFASEMLAIGLGGSAAEKQDQARLAMATAAVDANWRDNLPKGGKKYKQAVELMYAATARKEWASGDYTGALREEAQSNDALGIAASYLSGMPSGDEPMTVYMTKEQATHERKSFAKRVDQALSTTGLGKWSPGNLLSSIVDMSGMAYEGTMKAYHEQVKSALDDVAAPSKGKQKADMTERTLGWGDRESAMSSINRSLEQTNKSLRRTHTMLETLERRIASGGGTGKGTVAPTPGGASLAPRPAAGARARG